MNSFSERWHWMISGTMFGLIMLALNYLGGFFGLSSSYRTLCSIGGAGKLSSFFDINWKEDKWHLIFIGGIISGGCIAHLCQGKESSAELIAMEPLFTTSDPVMLSILFGGAFLSGLGARYAGGCTSGHFVSGISNLQLPSLVTLIFFMLGGFLTSLFLIPIINSLQ